MSMRKLCLSKSGENLQKEVGIKVSHSREAEAAYCSTVL